MISPVSILPPMDFKDHLSSWYVGDKTWDTFCKINIKNKIHLLSPLSSLLFPSDCAYIYIYILCEFCARENASRNYTFTSCLHSIKELGGVNK